MSRDEHRGRPDLARYHFSEYDLSGAEDEAPDRHAGPDPPDLAGYDLTEYDVSPPDAAPFPQMPTEVMPRLGPMVNETMVLSIVDEMPSYRPGIDDTQLIPIIRDLPVRERPPTRRGPAPPPALAEPGIGRSSRIMAAASATSRLTGFLRAVIIAAAIGSGSVGGAYATANNVPNIIYELLIGGVLTSVVVPLLVHAQRHHSDGGLAFAQRLLTLITVALTVAAAMAIVAAPLIVRLYGIGPGSAKGHLATLLARLLLVEIVFYGIAAMLGAILNTRGRFGAAAWAPVLNNVVVLATAAVFFVLPGPASLRPDTITTTQTLVLGIGTTLGIVVQALVLVPAARRIGFRWSWRVQLRGSGLGEAGALGAWVVLYVLISQIGYGVITHIANGTGEVGYAIYNNASLLFQTPYGIVGVALLTALLPRMSRAAAAGNLAGLVDDLSLGSRLTAIALLPITAAYIALGPALTTLVFAHGQTTASQGRSIGIVLAWSAFGLLPYAVTLLQMRAFYAVKDARTPTLINAAMVLIRVVLSFVAWSVLPADDVVAGLALVNSVSFIPGVILGERLLRRRFGPLQTRRVAQTAVRVGIASGVGGALAWVALDQVYAGLGHGTVATLVGLLCGCVIGGTVALALAVWLRVPEVLSVIRAVSRRLSRQ